jgi:hypothetical protein
MLSIFDLRRSRFDERVASLLLQVAVAVEVVYRLVYQHSQVRGDDRERHLPWRSRRKLQIASSQICF